MIVQVGTADFRNALRAVHPHAYPNDDAPQYHRVRIDIGPVNVTVMATNGFTAACAIVSVLDGDKHGDGELGTFDLSPADVTALLPLFKGKAGNGEDDYGETLRLDVRDDSVVVTDTSGLFDGRSLSLPRYPEAADFPDIQRLLAGMLARAERRPARLVTNGALLGAFVTATKVYKTPLSLEPTGVRSGIVVLCGESFIGLLQPIAEDPETTARYDGWRRDWLERFPAPTTTVTLHRVPSIRDDTEG